MEKVRSGQPVAIRASTWNSFVDAANYVKRLRLSGNGSGCRSGIGGGIVSVKNTTESLFPRFSAIVLNGICVTPETNEDEFVSCPSVFQGSAMTEAFEGMPFAILQEPLEPGSIGRAMLFGVTPARIAVSSADDGYAVPKTSSDSSPGGLESSATGVARILWKGGPTGIVWALLQLGGAGGGASEDKVLMCRVEGGSSQSGYSVHVYPNGRTDEGASYSSLMFVPDVALDSELPTGTWILGHRASLAATGGSEK